MSENYKFVQNRRCEFFPCHSVEHPEQFNCLFCYCPLYALKDQCGGRFTYKNNIKDCSNCTLPHDTGGYDHVMSRIREIIKIGSQRQDQ